ncbi:hypothetical protein OJAV_G00086200 [Oryzias javanicus]|uniref:B30.2/SPRY domain-containing protein n=1 Tax=Oryzias javanicus TaxID=123683 RepID=A0A3S2MVP9_ORYJA|nr:hypothetical protein OJAV_G00086200 [Oryzias javanicus]
MEVCRKHPGETNLFCKDEQRAFCPFCEFSLHQSHKVVPVEEAVRELKEELKSDLKSLQDKKMKYKEVEETYNQMIQHSKKQLLSTETQIRAEFNKLQQFLKEEEESRLAALREEEEQKRKTQSCRKTRRRSSAVLKTLRAESRAQSSLSDPQLLSGALIDVAKHVGNLSFRVWEKMKEKVHFSPVLLDPNTAASSLHLSDDLTSVRRGETPQQLPDNPERNMEYADVFGSEGFRSGKHSWEVEVGDHPYWFIGVVKESVNRKGECSASPKDGFWCLEQDDGKYTNGDDQTLTVTKSLQKIRVQLDYDRGEVSFYNPEDMTHIYTHKDTFTEKLLPYFNVGKSGDAKTSKLQICPTD